MKENEYVLIDSLIFSNDNDFIIDLSEYLENIYEYQDFIDNIKVILKKSKVKIVENDVVINSKTIIWNLKVKK
jgi:hypothetical protein